MEKKIKLCDIFTDAMVDGSVALFRYIYAYDSTLTTPILSDIITQTNYVVLDYDYLFGYSNQKVISQLTFKSLLGALDHEQLTLEDFLNGLSNLQQQDIVKDLCDTSTAGMLTKIIHQRFAYKWKKIWDALHTAYNPLENYSMEEIRTPDITKQTDGTGSTETSSKSSVYGFNSSNANPSDEIHGTQDDELSRTETETGTETLTRAGNIGVTTSQQMLESEFEVRKHDFYKIIYNDIDSILCLKCY